jgi:hypothetical protein
LDEVLLGDAAPHVRRTLQRFIRHQPADVALAGSLALAARAREKGLRAERSFGDIDVVAPSFDVLSEGLAADFVCPHVHPDVGTGHLLVQFVHPADAVRIDLFRAPAGCFDRAALFKCGQGSVAVLSLEDQASHAAAECMKTTRGGKVASKHMRDLDIMLPLVDRVTVEDAWMDHRRDADPDRFEEAAAQIRNHLADNAGCFVDLAYSTDITAHCPRCRPARTFRPAPQEAFAILGYV